MTYFSMNFLLCSFSWIRKRIPPSACILSLMVKKTLMLHFPSKGRAAICKKHPSKQMDNYFSICLGSITPEIYGLTKNQ